MGEVGFHRNVFYTPREVAAILGVSVRTVYRLIGDGRLRAKRVGQRNTRVYGADLARFLGIPVDDVPERREGEECQTSLE